MAPPISARRLRLGGAKPKAKLTRVAPPWPSWPLVERLELLLPGYRPPSFNELLRMHAHAKGKAVNAAMTALGIACLKAAGRKVAIRPPFRATWTLYANRLFDWGNLGGAFKLPEDALRYLGIIQDDRPTVLLEWVPQQVQVPKGWEGVSVLLEHLPEGARRALPRWDPSKAHADQ